MSTVRTGSCFVAGDSWIVNSRNLCCLFACSDLEDSHLLFMPLTKPVLEPLLPSKGDRYPYANAVYSFPLIIQKGLSNKWGKVRQFKSPS